MRVLNKSTEMCLICRGDVWEGRSGGESACVLVGEYGGGGCRGGGGGLRGEWESERVRVGVCSRHVHERNTCWWWLCSELRVVGYVYPRV